MSRVQEGSSALMAKDDSVEPPIRNIFEHTDASKIHDVMKDESLTLLKVHEIMLNSGLSFNQTQHLIKELRNAGIVFRERA
jgi:hypothetical protein